MQDVLGLVWCGAWQREQIVEQVVDLLAQLPWVGLVMEALQLLSSPVRESIGGAQALERSLGWAIAAPHAVDLSRVIESKRLRLTVEKASVVPTLWEMEVYDFGEVRAAARKKKGGS